MCFCSHEQQQQPTNHYYFHVLTTNHIMTTLTYQNQDQRHKYHYLTTTLHLTLKTTTAQETSVTNNSLSKDYPHLDDHAKQINKAQVYTLPSPTTTPAGIPSALTSKSNVMTSMEIVEERAKFCRVPVRNP